MEHRIRIDNPTIVRYIRDALGASMGIDDGLELSRQVQLTIPIEGAVLRPMEIIPGTAVSVTGNVYLNSLIVPPDEIWEIFGLRAQQLSGTFSVVDIQLYDENALQYPLYTVSATSDIQYRPSVSLLVAGGVKIGATTSGYSVTGNMRVTALLRRYKS